MVRAILGGTDGERVIMESPSRDHIPRRCNSAGLPRVTSRWKPWLDPIVMVDWITPRAASTRLESRSERDRGFMTNNLRIVTVLLFVM